MTDQELTEVSTQFRNGLLAGGPSTDMCFMASMALSGYLNAIGVSCHCVEGHVKGRRPFHHWWIKLKDGRIVDATADQFEVDGKQLPPVIAGSRPKFYRELQPDSPLRC